MTHAEVRLCLLPNFCWRSHVTHFQILIRLHRGGVTKAVFCQVRRSIRIKTENVTRQMPHMSYVNLLKDLTDGKPKSRRSGGGTAPTPV